MRSFPPTALLACTARFMVTAALTATLAAEEPTLNHLKGQTSPYLREHADNPVDWYPWGDEAFAKATREDKPIFLSIGYASCHWCHVMERESFRDAEIAEMLNRHFVAIKVDREERPDVDAVYIAFVTAQNGSAGWPLTVWLTPERSPFAGTTYLPPRTLADHPGLLPTLARIEELWRTDRVRVGEAAKQGLAAMAAPSGAADPGASPSASAIAAAITAFGAQFDPGHGGFGGAPKFPSTPDLALLARASASGALEPAGRARALSMLRATLDGMAAGGIHDQIGGGFHRYAVDEAWRVPHFEKMLSDQAQLAAVYVDAWRITGESAYRQTALDIIGYVRRDLQAPDGAFFGAEDADSLPDPRSPGAQPGERVEGAFYTWTRDQLRTALKPLDGHAGADAAERLAVSLYGLEDETAPGVLRRARTLADAAATCSLTVDQAEPLAARIAAALLADRAQRPRPRRDDKIVTAWNGLMISALARASWACASTDALADATRAAAWLRVHQVRLDGTLARSWADGAVGASAVGSDYACLIAGLLDLFEASGDPQWLGWAVRLQNEADTRLGDGAGGYFDAAADPSLPVRPRSDFDGAEPAPIAVTALNLLRLGSLLGDERRTAAAAAVIAASARSIARAPSATATLLCALDQRLAPALHLVVAGDAAAMAPLLAAAHSVYLPQLVLVPCDRANQQALADIAPEAGALMPPPGSATAVLCVGTTCLAPTSDPAMLARHLADAAH